MLYKVTKKYSGGSNELLVAEFRDASDAKMFIQARLLEDARIKVKVIYRILEGADLLEEFSEASDTGSASSGGTTGAGSQQRSNFQPTPFNMSPRPPGSPPHWLKDEEDDKDKK